MGTFIKYGTTFSVAQGPSWPDVARGRSAAPASAVGLCLSGRQDMDAELRRVLEAAFPGEDSRYFSPLSIGNTPDVADEGMALILDGIKTLTSSAFWVYPDGKIPFVGALSVLLDGVRRPRGIVETTRVEIAPFGAVTSEMACAYGEGDRTLEWWRRVMGAWYRESAARHDATFSEETPIIWEWIAVVRRL